MNPSFLFESFLSHLPKSTHILVAEIIEILNDKKASQSQQGGSSFEFKMTLFDDFHSSSFRAVRNDRKIRSSSSSFVKGYGVRGR